MRREVALGAVVLCLAIPAVAEEQLRRTGESLYQKGVTASGEPLQALVAGDVVVTGQQLSCATCHGKSGLGAVEGNRVVAPVAAPFLSVPRTLRSRPRPPYTDATLARAITEGVDSAGNPLDRLMPRFRLGRSDTLALVSYLKTLSARPSPGVEDDRIHLATVITPGVSPAARETMLSVLNAYFRSKTANAADHRKRLISSWPDYFGDWVLHVWELNGPPSTWDEQLKKKNRSQPVFAVVSGIGGETWLPVHRFCDRERLPCLLPNVDTPPAAGEYSLYFSGGLTIEAAVLASRLAQEPSPQRVVQIVGANKAAMLAARSVAEALEKRGGDRSIIIGLPATSGALASRLQSEHATAVIAWVGPEAAPVLGTGLGLPTYASATLLPGNNAIARATHSTLVSPYAPARDDSRGFRTASTWLARQGISVPSTEQRIADQTFFALTVLSEGLMHVKKNFFRDYLVEGIDHFSGFEHFSTTYPHLSFGPGQRVLSKGCYLIPSDGGTATWVLP